MVLQSQWSTFGDPWQVRVSDHRLAVESYCNPITHQPDFKAIPLSDRGICLDDGCGIPAYLGGLFLVRAIAPDLTRAKM